MLDHARDMGDEDRLESEAVPAGALVPYLKNAARSAQPTKPEVYKRQALSRVRNFSDRYDEF